MNHKVKIDLGYVQSTLFLPLWGRAVESRKKNPMLVDQKALEIMDTVDYDFSLMTKNLQEISQIAWIKRALICDQVIRQFLSRYPDGTIVNIGCGLDTTFERIDNGKVRWYDLDMPDVINLRRQFIAENDRRKFISSSFLEKDWLDQLEVKGNILFISAGVFYYFNEEQIKKFFILLAGRFPDCELLFDVCTPAGVRIANKQVIKSIGLGEKSFLIWGLKNKKELLTWDPRIKILQEYSYFRTLQNGLKMFLIGLVSDMLGMQYMLLLRL
jgi:O-methyltransferase involved in polyketide biosynthesis